MGAATLRETDTGVSTAVKYLLGQPWNEDSAPLS